MNQDNPQKKLFENIHKLYTDHYFDYWSNKYRQKFMYNKMFRGLQLNNSKIADLACGIGETTLQLKKKFDNITCVGFDISEPAISDYKNHTKCRGIVADLTKPLAVNEKFDAIFVVGGLHHCIQNLEMTLRNIISMLKKDGVFICMEPNAEYALEPVRKIWYKRDKYFDHNTEQALSPKRLKKVCDSLSKIKITYGGGPAFFLIFNSMIFRLPKSIKSFLSPCLILVDHIWNLIPCKWFHAFFVAQFKIL